MQLAITKGVFLALALALPLAAFGQTTYQIEPVLPLTPGAAVAIAYDVADNGTLLVNEYADNLAFQPLDVAYTLKNGHRKNLPSAGRGIYFGLNNRGDTVGVRTASLFSPYEGFLLDKKGSLQIFPSFNGSTFYASSITNNGKTIYGTLFDANYQSRGGILKNGVMTTLSLPGTTGTAIGGGNENGEAAGYATLTTGATVAIVTNGITTQQFSYPGATYTYGATVNTAGEVVGYFYDDSTFEARGFVRSGGSFTTIDASSILPPTVEHSASGETLTLSGSSTFLNANNDNGDIVGYVTATYSDAATGATQYMIRGFVAHPVN